MTLRNNQKSQEMLKQTYNDDEFRVKTTELGFTMTLTFDRWGGMRITKQNVSDYGTKKYQEIYLPRDAMFDLANKIIKNECGK